MAHVKQKRKVNMTKAAAVLTIRNAAKMSPQGRIDIAKWLDKQKKFFLDYPQELSPRFTARYLYDEDK